MLRDILVWGVLLGVVIILGRVILGSPLIARIPQSAVYEPFANGLGKVSGSATNEPFTDTNMCPPGSTREVYNGETYCCSNPRPGATTLKSWCKAPPHDKGHIFCTLGAAEHGVPNCKTVRDAIQKAKSEDCPKGLPHYVDGKCCADPGCKGASCMVVDGNYFKDETSCQFQKAKEEPCPADYDAMTKKGKDGFHLYGCSNNTEVCYSEAALTRLREMNYDVTGLMPCLRA